MGSLAAWNIRGLNHPLKQKEVRQLIKDNNLHVCAILETHVNTLNVQNVCKNLFASWSWANNAVHCNKGIRIMVGWDVNLVDVMVLAQSDQVIHTQILFKADRKAVFCSFVYADNHYKNRRALWENLCMHQSFMRDKPWILMGDFNCSLFLEDTLSGSSSNNIGMAEFKDCVESIEVFDVNSSGLHYTWTNKQQNQRAVFKKIDRILGNTKFIDTFHSAAACFRPYRLSDHTPGILVLPNITREKPKPFKFVNLLADKEGFEEEVKRIWSLDIQGVNMFKIVKKLKLLKTPLRKLMKQQGNLHENVIRARKEVDECQSAIDNDPTNSELLEKGTKLLQVYKSAVRDEALFLQQKSKLDWLDLGDSNTKYFHNVVKAKNHRSRIFSIKDASGKRFEGDMVYDAMVDHYAKFFGSTMNVSMQPTPDLFHTKLTNEKAEWMVRQVTDDEIKKAMFSIAGNKAPGPDGYTSVFFKRAWNEVGNDVCNAVKEFFHNGKLLQQLNHTVISLIPKVPTPDSITDYRPISCCNTLYKCISKIISDRMKNGLADIVSINQSAFVPGRRISDNILLTQELMHNYHRNFGPPRCAFKIDIQKAYDTVEWSFLENTLKGFGFHAKMIKWVMACVSSTSFSLAINGNLFGYFKGKRGLRQGDPMSPYLFTMVMEVLTLLLNRQVSLSNNFRFHNKCEKQSIINLCFADDLFIFARGDYKSAQVIMTAINMFKSMSGLVPSMAKSTVFFGNVKDQEKARILSIMPFEEGVLPVRYLGVPLVSTRLKYKDCKRLIESMESRITDWKAKCLSFAGRVQLIRSVLASMHIYWASVFILPKRVIEELEEKMRCFLWSQGNKIKGKAKVRWKTVCRPRCEGGLGIRRVQDMNIALMASHIWSLVNNRQSLWVKWIHSYRIRDRSVWDIPLKNDASWTWRKLLQLRPIIRNYIWVKVGDGTGTMIWFDKWHEICPISSFITPRLIANAGFNLNSKLAEILVNGEWRWPMEWVNRFPLLQQVQGFQLDPLRKDEIKWRTRQGVHTGFSSSTVWDDLRTGHDEVQWAKVVWFPQAIPRHAFLMWLILNTKLKTQDIMSRWNASGNANFNLMCCSLCTRGPDSHEHLFFECEYASRVWDGVKDRANMASTQHHWTQILDYLMNIAASKSADHIISKMVVSAAAYFVWDERNARLFSIRKRSRDQLVDIILNTVRMKLQTMRFRASSRTERALQQWRLPRGLLVADDDCG
ncbi:putative RNA-directed DNA polymerase [Helianthus annuus]|nr:putative RNA-directed DNA polymerase [Helianthus annuus]